jgi:hypothetical protein
MSAAALGVTLFDMSPHLDRRRYWKRSDLSDIPGKQTVIYVAEVVPGGQGLRHTHYEGEYVYILEGTLTVKPGGKDPITCAETSHSWGIVMASVKTKDRSRHCTRPTSRLVTFGGCSRGRAADAEVAGLIDALALVPGRVRVEADPERGCQHSRGEVLGIITALLAPHAIAVMLGNVAIHRWVGGACKADAGMDATARLVGLRPGHDTKGDLAGSIRILRVSPPLAARLSRD